MKKIMMFFVMVMAFAATVSAQEYIQVQQRCGQCWGYGAVTSYYGPVRCPSCGGYGVVVMTVRNPYYVPNNTSFRGASNGGSIKDVPGLKCPNHEHLNDRCYFTYKEAYPGAKPNSGTRCVGCGKTMYLHSPQK